MKYIYEFSDEENTIEIDESWSEQLKNLDNEELANQKKESRKHYHPESCVYEGKDFENQNNDINLLFKNQSVE